MSHTWISPIVHMTEHGFFFFPKHANELKSDGGKFGMAGSRTTAVPNSFRCANWVHSDYSHSDRSESRTISPSGLFSSFPLIGRQLDEDNFKLIYMLLLEFESPLVSQHCYCNLSSECIHRTKKLCLWALLGKVVCLFYVFTYHATFSLLAFHYVYRYIAIGMYVGKIKGLNME